MTKKLIPLTALLFLAMFILIMPVLARPLAAAPNAGDIVINEIMQNPSAVTDANGEWFEVKNISGVARDLDGCTITDNDSDSHTISSNTEIDADEYFVFCRNANSNENGGVTCDYDFSGFQLTNGDDEIIITCGGTEIDRVEYDGGTSWPDPTGASMTYNVPDSGDTSNNIGSNWQDSEDTPQSSTYGDGDYGTPGAENHDWMDGTNGRPTAITLRSLAATSPQNTWMSLTLLVISITFGGIALRWQKRKN